MQGFTLVELVLVIVLLVILAISFGPRFFEIDTFRARGFYDETLSALRYAQKTAIAQRRAIYVKLDATSVSTCYTSSFPISPPCGGSANQVPGPYGEKPYSISAGTGSLSPTQTLFFDALGRPYNADDTVPNSTFNTRLTLTLVGGGDTRTIKIEQETGYVR